MVRAVYKTPIIGARIIVVLSIGEVFKHAEDARRKARGLTPSTPDFSSNTNAELKLLTEFLACGS